MKDIKQAICEAPKRVIQIEDTLHVFLGTGLDKDVSQAIDKALKAGKTVVDRASGVSQWIDVQPVFDSTRIGSAQYVWKGDAVRVTRVLFTRSAEGDITRRLLGHSWRDADAVFNR
jgi:hypothetical protein